MVPLVQSIVSAAEILVDRFGVNEGLRPADALQLACALEANSRFSVGCDPDYRCSVKPVRQGIRADRQTVVLITICSQPTAGPQFRWSFGRARNS